MEINQGSRKLYRVGNQSIIKFKMKKILLLTILSLALITYSCNKTDEAEQENVSFLDDFTGTYQGEMETVNFVDANYKVVVSKVAENKIKIIPQGSNEQSFEVEVKKEGESTWVQANESPDYSVVLTKTETETSLSYWINDDTGGVENFEGIKQ